MRDDRYLPFEHSGVISQWQLQLPANPADGDPMQFDYDTISDVVMHIRYTAREGGDALGKAARDDLKGRIDAAEASGCVRLFSLRHDFPVAWAAYNAAPTVGGGFRPMTIELTPQHYPIWSNTKNGQQREVKSAVLIARGDGHLQIAKADGVSPDDLGTFFGDLKRTEITDKPPFTGESKAALTADAVEDAWLLIQWDRPSSCTRP